MDTCEMEDCDQDAVASVHAQWTIFDFIDYRSCDTHIDDMLEGLALRTVDGKRPVDLWVQWYFDW